MRPAMHIQGVQVQAPKLALRWRVLGQAIDWNPGELLLVRVENTGPSIQYKVALYVHINR